MDDGANTDLGAPGALFVETSRADGQATLRVAGELDLVSGEALDLAIRDAEESDAARIVVDLRELSFIDSTGLSVLLAARRRSSDGRLRFVASKHDARAAPQR
jgi:stage II sporulation protein AA (anti-sigma F factor antagonist)